MEIFEDKELSSDVSIRQREPENPIVYFLVMSIPTLDLQMNPDEIFRRMISIWSDFLVRGIT